MSPPAPAPGHAHRRDRATEQEGQNASEYERFLAGKHVEAPRSPVPHGDLDARLFHFQRDCVRWALERGRAALFEDCGLGKTRQQLEWARHVAAHAGRVLIFAPLAVAQQTIREGANIDVPVAYARDMDEAGAAPIVITNYERLDRFAAALRAGVFAGVVLDESSILKSFMGKTKRALIDACASVPYRLACTATPAPNDHLELGNHAEFLGVMASHEMIARWFINDTSTFGTYRLKGHAVAPFWDWVASWAMCVGRPSDLGYPDDGYALPELTITPHVLDVDLVADRGDRLFRMPDMSATAIHKERRRTATARAAKIGELVARDYDEQWLVWCETDYEADALREVIPEAVDVRGSHALERKERVAIDFADGRTRVLISKPSIFGWGLNFQRCARVAFTGATFSYEGFYQAIRRCWRFGQRRPVHVHVAMASTEASVWKLLTAKSDGHDEMRVQMSAAMRRAQAREAAVQRYRATTPMRLPNWLRSEAA
ncbi:DEAD/DEAH box helicase [Sandaracinus amylolyticus]|uniref:Superfamily II DNA/RNA helicase, SNF2 family n=1 Tax=Sandaracinus amylolyticus TaxID=927083 RepID=A0A0F6SGK7_9BACT|nr:DEAD/DEAH box helicase [Sandaracinus amylolyticus]AKF08864.1 Superfamily II DNA/RNA helicase, SNF2 family [Sandaracinus amylolyticus]